MSQSEMNYKALVEQLEEWTRQGKNALVLHELRRLKVTKVPREFCFPLAQIARRISQPLLSLQMMNPVVRSPFLLAEPPTAKEKIVYATSLTALGLLTESQKILAEIDPGEEPDALLYRSFALFGEWNYARTLPLLRRYVRSAGLTNYQRVVGQVNLAAALSSEGQFGDADHLLAQIIAYTNEQNFNLLLGNAYEIRSQIQIMQGNYSEALKTLALAERQLEGAQGLYHFFVLKWQRITELLMNPKSEDALLALSQLRTKARLNGYWESVRDCDLFSAIARRDQALLHATLAGTPFLAFHRRAERLWGGHIALEDHYDWAPSGDEALRVYDPQELREPAPRRLVARPTLLKLLSILVEDFYRPASLGQIFFRLFAEEQFDPQHSPQRIYKVAFRLRSWLRESAWPFAVEIRRNEFRLVALEKSAALRVVKRRSALQRLLLAQWHKVIGSRSFSARQFAEGIEISQRQANYLLRAAVSHKTICIIGRGRARRYRFSNHRMSQVETNGAHRWGAA